MGGLLLGAIVATFAPRVDPESVEELLGLMTEIEADRHVPQPRMRHRFQTDRVGLQRITYSVSSVGEKLTFVFPTDKATATQHLLVAAYAVRAIGHVDRPVVLATMRRAIGFPGGSDSDLLRYLTGSTRAGVHALSDPVVWALETLEIRTLVSSTKGNSRGVGAGLDGSRSIPGSGVAVAEGVEDPPPGLPRGVLRLPTRSEVQRAFRDQLRRSHPDHGGAHVGAAQRIADLAEARRILLDR